jgi:hypothetical protein
MLPPAAQGAAAAGAPLLLRSPHSHWLIGSLSKAEAQYRPANTWGVAMIGVPQCPDDVVYGLAVVLDFLPALQQRQAQLALASQLPPALEAAAGGSSSSQGGLTAAGDTQPPGVFLRCNRAVARDGRLQLARGNDEGRKGEWQVLVNGRPYPERQGRNGLQLFAGDVITVQGLRFKLQLSRMVVQ